MNLYRMGLLLCLLALAACAGTPKPDAPTAAAKSDTAASLEAADATRNDGRLTEAIAIYQEILVLDRTSVPAQYGMAECLLGLGRAKDAKSIFEALEHNSEFRARALQGVGISELALHHNDAAEKALKEAVAADAQLWRAYNGLGLIADEKRQSEQAVELYGKALGINPDSAVLLNNLGYSRLIAGKSDEAIADFRKALALDPHSVTIQNNLRIATAVKGKYDEATQNIPRDQRQVVLNNVGYVAMSRGDLDVAQSLLSRARDSDPRYDATTAKNLDQLNSLKAANQ